MKGSLMNADLSERAALSPELNEPVVSASVAPPVGVPAAKQAAAAGRNRRKSDAPGKGMGSACAFAISIFIVANFCLSFFSVLHFDEYRFPYKGWAWWAFNDLKSSVETHNVALLGSSLMVSAVAGVDANYLQKTLDLSQYHKCTYLDQQLHTRFGGMFNTFNLAVPGQMPSDAYLALKGMVQTANRPDIVIYGVAPRDFIDSTMSSPSDTEPFRYLRRLVSIDDVAGMVFRSPFSRLEWFLQRYVYLYRHAIDLQLSLGDAGEWIVQTFVPRPHNEMPFTWWDRIKLLPSYLPGEIVPLAVTTGPIDEEAARKRWIDNTREYVERYKKPDKETYETQFYFLGKLADYCRKERIELVLVNMPITSYNIHLLTPTKYISYVERLRQFSFTENVRLYDLCQPANYAQNDFHDSVHLNAYGGEKLFDQLINLLSADERIAPALHLAGQELKRHQTVAASRRIVPVQ